MEIKKVVVIGSGTMGSGIAAHLCNANIPVTLLDLKTEDKKIMNRNSLLEVSKKILEDNKDFKAPSETQFNLPGNIVKVKMMKVLEKLYNDKVILDHGIKVGEELANVLSGGDTTIDKTLSEEDLFKLELDAFMMLIETKETQDRIKYTLATGKHLIN
jgi:3-hydroxyacyl-CoA dehydrogenase